ncbi:MAG: TMEM165/GDT1 family protein [Bdellovibrio sp.]|nr:TMEM165/GDT1 family protein [Bdellovibrio sp.]
MDWKIFLATFSTIFVAEIGDKTQFAALAAASQTKATLSVLLATVLALSLAGTLGVLGGSLLGNFFDPAKMKYVSGPLFVLMGIWILFRG